MDPNKLIEILRATIDPNQREAAEQQLEQVLIFILPVFKYYLCFNNFSMLLLYISLEYIHSLSTFIYELLSNIFSK